MGHGSYEENIKKVYWGMILLAVVTLIEVAVSLFGKGHLGFNPAEYLNVTLWLPFIGSISFNVLLFIVGLALIVLSIYKAYFIIYKFMHMGDEVKGLRMSVLLPVLLLVWAIIAFFQEGNAWKNRRTKIIDRNNVELNEAPPKKIGMLYDDPDWEIYKG